VKLKKKNLTKGQKKNKIKRIRTKLEKNSISQIGLNDEIENKLKFFKKTNNIN
jgi:hypothetical protein